MSAIGVVQWAREYIQHAWWEEGTTVLARTVAKFKEAHAKACREAGIPESTIGHEQKLFDAEVVWGLNKSSTP